MKYFLIVWYVFSGLPAWGVEPVDTAPFVPVAPTAQATPQLPTASSPETFPSEDERELERKRLTQARQQLEDQYNNEAKQCYQNFDVTTCRLQARDRRLQAHTGLRQQELRFNAQERQIRVEKTRRSVAERNSEASQLEAQEKRAAAMAAAKERADTQAQKLADHAQQGTKREQYEQKQREAAQHKADLEKKLREQNKTPAAPLPVPTR